ncbi:alpha-amylase family glycosyl hydrolase [Clostridium sp. BJN0001]|uniref:alpha-amylase family glycosyl hydrolase n=1 Tax=Clostridium sp. BJN0001 TaxID=2930219 RepID=UPI001FD5F7BF|nr:alpha-amylase family glycosyl hydrolase [Clostridium sp. BJN0001]
MNNWIQSRIFYHIFPLGFCGVLKKGENFKKENRLIKIENIIPKLKELNINAIYFSPVFESTYHGYDTTDYRKIDKRLGSNEDFKILCKKLHENDIKIVLDGVFNHVGRDFFAFKDVLENREKSRYVNYFANLNFNSNTPMNDGLYYEGWNGCHDLVKLNLWNDDVVNYLLESVGYWIDEFDIDGLRLDAADQIELNFFKKLREYTNKKKENFWLMGEIIHGDYNRWANSELLDSVTNYECYKGIYSSHNTKNYFEIAYSLNRQFGDYGIYKNLCLYNFVDNHDVNRLASTITNPMYIYNVYTILFTMPGIPSIYYGSEYGIKGVKKNGSDDDLRPEIDYNNIQEPDIKLYNLIKKLSKIRLNSKALKYGSYRQIMIKNEQYVFLREYKDEKVYVLLNLSDKDTDVEFNLENSKCYDLLNENSTEYSGGHVKICVKAFSAKILK